MVGKNIGHGSFMIEIKNIVKTLSPERNPSTRLKTDNLRYSAFSAELENRGSWGPRGILCTRGEKEYASIRQAIVACGDWLVKREACDAFSVFNDYVRLFEFGNVRIIICWLLVEKQITDELLKSASKYARLDNKKRPWERSFFVGA